MKWIWIITMILAGCCHYPEPVTILYEPTAEERLLTQQQLELTQQQLKALEK